VFDRPFAVVAALLAISSLGCPGSFEAKNPPCLHHQECSPRVLGADFVDYLCVDNRCQPKSVWGDGGLVFPDAGRDEPAADGGFDHADTGIPGFEAGPAWDSGPEPDVGDRARCGNSIIEPPEECDDGNQVSGDGCSADCMREESQCGNGQLEAGEECDDGNEVNGDGCDSECRNEIGGSVTVCDLHDDGLFSPCTDCHGGASPRGDLRIDVTSAQTLYNSLVVDAHGEPVTSPRGPAMIRPSAPNESLLYRKLVGTHLNADFIGQYPDVTGVQMPKDAAPWSDDDVAKVVQWISRDIISIGACLD
jgi:cysteine-rich repeat protein